MTTTVTEIRGCGNQRTAHSIIRTTNQKSGQISGLLVRRRFVDLFPFDAEYLRRLRAGDPAVEEHFASYFGKLLTIKVRARGYSRPDMHEVIQEAFYRVIKVIRAPDG